MKKVIFFCLLLAAPLTASATEITGYVAGEGTLFIEAPLFEDQEQNAASLASQVELYHAFAGGSSFTATLFGRIDSADEERTHADLREFSFLYLGNGWEMKGGISKVYWGVTEFSHLVDIINQTDGVESIDGEEKLGQPMLHFSYPASRGTFDFFVLPLFRERTFPGANGRLRAPLIIDTANTTYESSDKERHIDYAARYSHTMGDWDFALSHFSGTSREPLLIYTETATAPLLRPHYSLMEQTGLELQLMAGDWIWKLESTYRHTDDDDFIAADVGFEYSFYGVFNTAADVGAIVEYLFDSRDDEATSPYNHDVALGLRLAFNDVQSSELLLGLVNDTKSSARAVVIEGTRRFGDSAKVTIEGGAFLNAPETDTLYSFRQESYFKLEVAKYF